MFVDACAIVSVFAGEPEAATYETAIDGSDDPWTTALAVFEAVMVLARPSQLGVGYVDALDVVLRYLDERCIALRELGDPKAVLQNAVALAVRHGVSKKTLSAFDCFHYASAKTAGSPMLTLDRLLRDTDVPTLP